VEQIRATKVKEEDEEEDGRTRDTDEQRLATAEVANCVKRVSPVFLFRYIAKTNVLLDFRTLSQRNRGISVQTLHERFQ
jgi:hypothetical protein